MLRLTFLAVFTLPVAVTLVSAVASQSYTWKNVKIGGGGGFVPNIVFNPSQKGLAYARTDIGGAYKLNADDSWTPLLDFVDDARWNYWGVDALATDPVDPDRLYLATGMYTNSWDPKNGQILISTDQGKTFIPSLLPFKVGGNMPGRGMGERLAVDPNSNNILFFGARSGNGLWKSTDFGATWTQVKDFPSVGTYVPDPTDTSGYNNDIMGLSWVTFDSTSGSSGKATPRIFVGVANKGSDNIFVSTDAGATWSAVAGQNNTFIPHKGVLSPAEKALYISYSDGAGPYDGTTGSVYRYDIAAGTFTDITPVSGGDLYFGFGGVAVDLQRPGTIMVAALNSWWPDGQIFRSTDSGKTWTGLWEWASYPTLNRYYTYDDSLAPWIGPDETASDIVMQIGWMMEGLSIDPFDSNHWLYGTGETIYGGHDLLKWDSANRNVTLKSLADGIEETSVQGLISPPVGAHLISAIGDVDGFVHTDLDSPPLVSFSNPTYSSSSDIDYAGNVPTTIVRIGTTTDGSQGKQVAISTDSGNTWSQDYGAPDDVAGGKVAISANGDTVLWKTSGNGILVSQDTNPFAAVSSLPSDAVIASDKKNNSIFYGASGSKFYLSVDGGKTFTATGSLGSSTSPAKVIVHPNVTGDVWVSTDKGIFHSTDTGSTFTAIPGVSQAWAIALGAPKTSGGYPALFAAANIGGVGYFRSDDAGANWVKINDAAHGFGSASANCIAADLRIYGRVYIGTNGRGIFYGDAAGAAPAPTSTVPVSSTSAPASSTTPVSSSSSVSTRPTSSSTSTSSHSSSSSRTSSAPTSTPTVVSPVYGQCGGIGWTGATACAAGSTCVAQNPYYSQCVPS
ncbi:Glycoside Hydrolase Family 74 / Carbohydrate-Binding Module Family 1 protein [Trametes cinnabarina]|uniref:Glycoside Hydrolase Family 74 / Carbohydrate-Binding Module Family 1 protein n=1 Tax=Pycnoporus cinnabarinus TaxID=5643 RepID=A0A060SCW9_PYCCI|nr:Glycoside Hydrolase Family 74 / Carbohydrate-Binding Module Family 1 protein [Trametes cinnabarina]